MSEERVLVKVGRVYEGAPYSRLVLSHKLLAKAGLSPGDYLEVKVGRGEITLRKVKVTPE